MTKLISESPGDDVPGEAVEGDRSGIDFELDHNYSDFICPSPNASSESSIVDTGAGCYVSPKHSISIPSQKMNEPTEMPSQEIIPSACKYNLLISTL